MTDRTKGRTGLAAAVSLLGLSLGVTGAEAQKQPETNNQGVLIGLDKPATSGQIKGQASNQVKLDSNQVKGESQQIKSMSLKFDSNQQKGATSTQLKSPESNQFKSPESNQLKGATSTQLKTTTSTQLKGQ